MSSEKIVEAISTALAAKEPGEKFTVSQLARLTGYGPGMLSARLQSYALPLVVPGVTWGREHPMAPLMIWRTDEAPAVPKARCGSGRHQHGGDPDAWLPRASFLVQYRGQCRSSVYSCGRCLVGVVRTLSKRCTHDEHEDREPAILHVEAL